ncbi:MAG: NERD domain-containing protein [Firmicutes bacterium]|nr:NERD domain-containing protein [Bacillota bacterium]
MSIYSFIDSLLGIDENEVVGKNGERLTANKLKWISFMGREGRILKNVYIPKKDGDTTEIDLLFITEKGIFVIESKNYSGYIFGDGKTAKWTTTLFAGRNIRGQKQVEKHQFYNPIWQNYNHIKYLKEFLGTDVQMISLIVFSERCELKSITYQAKDVYVCKRDKLTKIIKDLWNKYPDTLKAEDIDSIYDKLSSLTNMDSAVKTKHVEYIKKDLIITRFALNAAGN